MEEKKLGGMGWERDLPDFRDFTPEEPAVKSVLAESQPLKAARSQLPASVDLREYCPPIENQGSLGSCTANAGVGLLEYFQRRAFGEGGYGWLPYAYVERGLAVDLWSLIQAEFTDTDLFG